MTKKLLHFALLLAPSFALAGCGQSGGSSSTTKMTNVEVVDGTISDDMILLDTSTGDGTAVDTTATGDLYETIDKRPKPAESAATKSDDAAETKTDAPVEKAEPSADADDMKTGE